MWLCWTTGELAKRFAFKDTQEAWGQAGSQQEAHNNVQRIKEETSPNGKVYKDKKGGMALLGTQSRVDKKASSSHIFQVLC